MARKSGQSILLLCMLFAFACLLLGGGHRLVACEQEDDLAPVRAYASIRAALSSAGTREEQGASVQRRSAAAERMHAAVAQENQALKHPVLSDANGNVLAAGTYMRAVYQAFVLDDGFV